MTCLDHDLLDQAAHPGPIGPSCLWQRWPAITSNELGRHHGPELVEAEHAVAIHVETADDGLALGDVPARAEPSQHQLQAQRRDAPGALHLVNVSRSHLRVVVVLLSASPAASACSLASSSSSSSSPPSPPVFATDVTSAPMSSFDASRMPRQSPRSLDAAETSPSLSPSRPNEASIVSIWLGS